MTILPASAWSVGDNRWDEKAGLQRDALSSQVIDALEATEETPEALFALFQDWQRTQTQSSATALRSLRQQMDVRSCREQGPLAERHRFAGR
jgi:hypothetical protein